MQVHGDANDDSSDVAAASRKIARLTEVVCELHTACDAHEREKASALESFARDIALTRYEASNAIYREASARERAEDDARGALARSAVADAMRLCANEERREVTAAMKSRLRLAAKEFRTRDENREAQTKVRIATVKAACERDREATERAREEALRAEMEARMRIVENARAVEEELMNDLRFERNERGQMEKEFAREIEALRAAHAAEMEKVNAEAEARVERVKKEMCDKTIELERVQKDHKDSLDRERALAREKYDRQRSAYEFVEKSLAETASELECTQRAHETCRRSLDELSASANEHEKTVIGLRTELTNKTATIGDMRARLDRLIASEIDLARKLSESQEAYATSIEERTKLRENIETEQQSQAAMSTAHAEHVHELEETIYDLRATIRRNESVVELATRDGEERLKKLLSDLEERNEKAESETNELVNSYEARIKAMEVEHSANHARALAEFAERADVAESRHEEAISALNAAWLRKENEWKDEKLRLESSLECATSRESKANDVVETYEARHQTLSAEMERIKSSAEAKETHLVDQIRDSKLALNAVEALTHKLEKKMSERELEYESERSFADQKLRDEINRTNALWERKTKENVQIAIEESHRTHESAMERLMTEMEMKAKGDVARAVANVSEAYHANERELREEIDDINRQHAKQLETMAFERDRAVSELQADCNHRLESLSATHVCEIERLTASHRERVEMMDEEHAKRLKHSMAEAVRLAVREVEAQHDAREADRAEKAAANQAQELKCATDEYARDLERLEREYETKLESCIAVSTTLELERESLRSQLRRAREELGAAELERAMDVEKSRDAAVATAYAHESEIDSMRKEHKITIARMQDVNESAAKVANEALSASRAEISKWRAMYEKRESRPEDVRRIKDLETELRDVSERLERSAQHRRTLQSELLGRASEFDATSARKRGGLSLKRAHAAYAAAPRER